MDNSYPIFCYINCEQIIFIQGPGKHTLGETWTHVFYTIQGKFCLTVNLVGITDLATRYVAPPTCVMERLLWRYSTCEW